MCKEYGTEIIRLNALVTSIIVIDTLEPALELLNRRSSKYSDRPRMIMLNELSAPFSPPRRYPLTDARVQRHSAGFGLNYGSMQYDEAWRECRKMTYREFHPTPFEKYRSVLEKNAHGLLRRPATRRGIVLGHLLQVVGANIMEIVYDIDVRPEHDPFIALARTGQECVAQSATGSAYPVDIFPLLRFIPSWFPGAGLKRQAAVWHQAAEKQLHVAYDDFLRQMAAGTTQDCMARSLIEAYGNGDPVSENCLRATTATMYLGGSETTAAAMHTFFLAMALYPAAQAKARQKLDDVLGPCRLPTFADASNLPYVDAIVKEVLRWHPIVSLLMSHRSSAEDV
ncbi:cytochrome P450 [Trametes elegans]|nr:cytochrome P450 [Trametes elegans]